MADLCAINSVILLCEDSHHLTDLIARLLSEDFLTTEKAGDEILHWLVEKFYLLDELNECGACLTRVLRDPPNPGGFWKSITDLNKLLGLIFVLLDSTKQGVKSVTHLESAALAANIYLSLLLVPGHHAHQVFHSVVFGRCLDLLQQLTRQHLLEPLGRQSSLSMSQASTLSLPSQRRRKRKNTQNSQEQSQDNDLLQLTPGDVQRFYRMVVQNLQTLAGYLRSNHIRSFPENIETTSNVLAGLISTDQITNPTSIANLSFDHTRPESSVMSVSHLAFLNLSLLCLNHNVSGCGVGCVFQALRKYLLMSSFKITGSAIPRDAVALKDLSLQFVRHVVKEGGDAVEPLVLKLIKSLIRDVNSERTEFRSKCGQMIHDMMKHLKIQSYALMIKNIFILTRNPQVSHRMMALELIGLIITSNQLRNSTPDVPGEVAQYMSKCVLLQAVLVRCSDKSHLVIGKALSILAACLLSDEEQSRDIRQFITPRTVNRRPDQINYTDSLPAYRQSTGSGGSLGPSLTSQSKASGDSDAVNTIATAASSDLQRTEFTCTSSRPGAETALFITKGFDITLADSDGLISMIKRRMQIPKVVVRKAALAALDAVIRYNDCDRMQEEVSLIEEHCRDVALLVRKQALQFLTDIVLTYPDTSYVQESWIHGVLPAATDDESSVQLKALDVINQVIFQNLSKSGDLGLQLLARVDASLYPILTEVCTLLHKQKLLSSSLVNTLFKHTTGDFKQQAWMLLVLVSPLDGSAQAIVADQIAEYWLDKAHSLELPVLDLVLNCLTTVANEISADIKARVSEDICLRVKSYGQVSSVRHLVAACAACASDDSWATEVVTEIQTKMEILLTSRTFDNQQGSKLPCYLLTLAETALFHPCVSQRVFHFLKSLILKPQPGTNLYALVSEVQKDTPWSKSVKQAAMFTLCQLCLQNSDQASQCLPILAHELETSQDVAIRQTIVIAISDMCKLYTNVVSPFVSCLSASLKDESVTVRRSAFVAITRLLQEDFLKWRGCLFFRIISVINDEDQQLSQLAKQCFVHELLRRHTTMFSQHFVECIFHFNNLRGHKTYNQFKQTDVEITLFSLEDSADKLKRMFMFKFMLTNMSDSQKFTVTQKLCKDVLSSLVEKEMCLDNPKVVNVLSDTLEILSCQEVKITIDKASAAAIDHEEELADPHPQTAKVRAAASAAVHQLLRRNFIELVIPDILALKHMLGQKKSPVVRNLMVFLIEIMKDYKTEMADVLSANPQLAVEIEFDKRKFEEQLVLEQQVGEKPPDATLIQTPGPVVGPSGDPGTPAVLTTHGVSGTPVMPPPPPKSALKTPAAVGRVLVAASQSLSTLSLSKSPLMKTPGKRVNFNDASDSDEDIENVGVAPVVESEKNRTTVRRQVLNQRAISTPGGRIADITFTTVNISVLQGVSLTPISNAEEFGSTYGTGEMNGRQVMGRMIDVTNIPANPANWKITSPVAITKSKKPTKMRTEATNADPLESLSQRKSANTNQAQEKPANQKRKTRSYQKETNEEVQEDPLSVITRSQNSRSTNEHILIQEKVINQKRITRQGTQKSAKPSKPQKIVKTITRKMN